MAAGADSVDDLQVVRSGGMKRLFDQVYPPATLGQLLRESTYGQCLQLPSGHCCIGVRLACGDVALRVTTTV
jgi:hypothetical protein